MAHENSNESSVVWHPGSVENRPKLSHWTPLFLFHDHILVMRLLLPRAENDFLDSFCRLLDSGASLYDIYQLGEQSGLQFSCVLGWLRNRDDIKARHALNLNLIDLEQAGIVKVLPVSPEKLIKAGMSAAIFENIHTPAKWYLSEAKSLEHLLTDMNEGFNAIKHSAEYGLPLIVDESISRYLNKKSTSTPELSSILAQTAICQIALPQIVSLQIDDILAARNELRDELLEFRAGILRLTWLLHQQVGSQRMLEEIRREAGVLVDTEIRASLLSLENRIRMHANKRVRRLLFGTARILVDFTNLFFSRTTVQKLGTGGKFILQLASEIGGVSPPEDQVATYLYRLRDKMESKGSVLVSK